jgi:anti-sigma factor ChrR (cupin superfamily)
MPRDSYRMHAPAYAAGVLDPAAREAFEVHLLGCPDCGREVSRRRAFLESQGIEEVALDPVLREQLLDLAKAPSPPVDVQSYQWMELAPGLRVHVLRRDATRHMQASLLWASPGARHPLHRHTGDEVVLVLEGVLQDHRGTYRPGEICRSSKGSSHAPEALLGADCVCYVLTYGG